MGYELHITRQLNWYDEVSDLQISIDEWKACIKKDPEMRLDNFAEATTPSGKSIRIYNEGLAVWTKYSGENINSNHAWFDYSNGNISVKNPDEEIMKKMLSIANYLNARIQGDEGEMYDMAEINKAAFALESFYSKKQKPWWKFW